MKRMKMMITKKMRKIKEKTAAILQKIQYGKAVVTMAVMCYLMNPVVAQASLTTTDLQTKTNNLLKAIMLLEVGIVGGVFVVVCNKDLIVYISTGDDGERKAAIKNIKGKVPALIAALLMSELVTLVVGYFVSSITMPT